METRVNVYLTFNDNCAEAMEFYHQCLGGELKVQKVGEVPSAAEHMPPEAKNKVMHASLTKGNLVILASDFMRGEYKAGNDVSICLDCGSEAEIRDYFAKLSAGGTVGQDLQDTFWGAIYGDCQDKFGKYWMFNFMKPKA